MSDGPHLTPMDGAKVLANVNLTPEEWVGRYCQIHCVAYHYKTNSFREQGEVIDCGLLLSQMRLLAFNLEQTHLKSLLPDAIAVWKKEEERAFLRRLRKHLHFKLPERDWIGEWVGAATSRQDPLDVAVMRHFVWQVRRKLYGLPVEHHMMPTLYGKSGGGKSVAMHALLKPLSDVSIGREMTVFNDPFGRRQFTRNFIMCFDELGKSHQADINSLKNIVTASEISWRGMNSESTHSAPQNCTFIGASNFPVRDRIQDTTSARRFWQLNCAATLDWNAINTIDYEALWSSIDEHDPSPVFLLLEQIQAVQNAEIRAKDPVEQWIEASCEATVFDEGSPTTEELFKSFRGWCVGEGIASAHGLQTFARGLPRRFETMGWPVSSKRTHRGTAWSMSLRS
jgi:hypothetical protein